MAPISTKAHGAIDYATGAAMLAAPSVLRIRDRRAAAVLWGAGAGVIGATAFTDHELALRRTLPMPAHLALDALTGIALVAVPRAVKLRRWLPHAAFGICEIAVAALTERRPAQDRTSEPRVEEPRAATGVTGEGLAAREPARAGAPIAPAPIDAPGPSVNAPASGGSDVERAEWADETRPDAQEHRLDDDLVAQEANAAAAAAARIGGMAQPIVDDPAMDPVYQAGGGEQDGWETAEEALIENATHGDGHGDPLRDAFAPEVESDAAGAVYGEADRLASTEVVNDPETGEDDAGAGPGLAAER